MTAKNETTKEQPPEQALQTNGDKTPMMARTAPVSSLWPENPFVFMRRFAEDMERFFEDFGNFRIRPLFSRELMPRVGEFGRAVWSPEVELIEHDGQLIVRADLPGLSREQVKVEVTQDALIISGERKDEFEHKEKNYYRSERAYGSFYRRVPLPQGVKTEGATAQFKDGVLEVMMQAPKREQLGRTLEIKAEAGQASAQAAAK